MNDDQAKHPAKMINEWDGQMKEVTVKIGGNPVYSSNDPAESFRVFAYLHKHQEECEDDEGELLPLAMVANGDSVVVGED